MMVADLRHDFRYNDESPDMSFMSWEPMISKHPSGYDSPWQRERIKDRSFAGKKIGPAREIIVTDTSTGKKIKCRSVNETARKFGIFPAKVCNRIQSGKPFNERYLFEYA